MSEQKKFNEFENMDEEKQKEFLSKAMDKKAQKDFYERLRKKKKKHIEEHPNSMYAALPVNSKLYGVFPADYDYDEYDWCNYVDIYEIDIENKKTIFCSTKKLDFTETVYSRGNRIYFLNSRNIQNFICTYYDTETGEWGEEFSITQEEILKM